MVPAPIASSEWPRVVVTCDDQPCTVDVPVSHQSRILPWMHDPLTNEVYDFCDAPAEGAHPSMTVDMADHITLSRAAVNFIKTISAGEYPLHFYTFDSEHLSDFIGIGKIADFFRCYGLMETFCPVETDHAIGLLLTPEISDHVKTVWLTTIKWFEDAMVNNVRMSGTSGGDMTIPYRALRLKSLNMARWAIVESKIDPKFPRCALWYHPRSTIGASTRTRRLPEFMENAAYRLIRDLPGASAGVSATCMATHRSGHSGGWVISGGFVRDLMMLREGNEFIPKDIDFFLTGAYCGTVNHSVAPTAPVHRANAVLAFIAAQLESTDGWVAVQTKRVITLRHQQARTSIQLVIPSSVSKELQVEPFHRFDIDACRGMLMCGRDLGGFPHEHTLFVNASTVFFEAIATGRITCAKGDVSEQRLTKHIQKGWRVDDSVMRMAQYRESTIPRRRPASTAVDRTSPHDIEYLPDMTRGDFFSKVHSHKHASVHALADFVESVTDFMNTRTTRSTASAVFSTHPWLNITDSDNGDDYYAWGNGY